MRAGPALRDRAAGGSRVGRAELVRAHARADFPLGAFGPAESRRLRRCRRRRWGDVRLRSFGCARRLGGCITVRVAAVWRARHQRRRMAPLRFTIFVGKARAAVKDVKVLEVDYLRRFRRFLPKKSEIIQESSRIFLSHSEEGYLRRERKIICEDPGDFCQKKSEIIPII